MPRVVDLVMQTDRLPSLPAAYLNVKRVTIPRQSRGLSVAGPSKGPTRDGQKRFLRLLQPAIRELDAP